MKISFSDLYIGELRKEFYNDAFKSIVNSMVEENKTIRITLSKIKSQKESLMKQKQERLQEIDKSKNDNFLRLENDINNQKNSIDRSIAEQKADFRRQYGNELNERKLADLCSQFRREQMNSLETQVEKVRQSIHESEKQQLDQLKIAVSEGEKALSDLLEELTKTIEKNTRIIDNPSRLKTFEANVPIPVQSFELLSGPNDTKDKYRQYRVMGGCGLSFSTEVPKEIPSSSTLLIEGLSQLHDETPLKLKEVSILGQQYSIFKLVSTNYDTVSDEDYLWLSHDSHAARGHGNSAEHLELTSAIFNNDEHKLKQLVGDSRYSKALREKDSFGQSIGHYAASIPNSEIMEIIRAAGADITAVDDQNQTVLHIMALANNNRGVTQILKWYPELYKQVSKNGHSLFHTAAQYGSNLFLFSALSTLREHSDLAYLLNSRCASGVTPTYLALFNRHSKTAASLIQNRLVDVNVANTDGSTALHIAAANEQLDGMRALLRRGADVSLKRKDKALPLHIACEIGNERMIVALVQAMDGESKYSMLNAELQSDTRPLHLAVGSGFERAVTLLIRNGADPNKADWDNTTPLMLSAKLGRVSIARELIETKGIKLDAIDSNGRTALYFAAENGLLTLVQLLMHKGAKCNKANNSTGMTSIHYLAMNGALDILADGFKQGNIKAGDLKKADANGKTPYHYALEHGNMDLVAWIRDTAKVTLDLANSPLQLQHFAASAGDLYSLRYIANNKQELGEPIIEPKAIDHGKTPLYFAVEKAREHLFDQLLYDDMQRYSPNHKPVMLAALRSRSIGVIDRFLEDIHHGLDQDGNTAGHISAINGDIDLLKLLRSRGFNLESKNALGETVLHQALVVGSPELTRFILLNITEIPKTAIHYAVRHEMLEIVEEIAQKPGVDLNHVDVRTGRTPLMEAVTIGSRSAMESLFSLGADVKALGASSSPLLLAINGGDHLSAEFLLSKGASTYDNRLAEIPLHSAIRSNHWQCVEVLLKHKAKLEHKEAPGVTTQSLLESKPYLKSIQSGKASSIRNQLISLRDDIENQKISAQEIQAGAKTFGYSVRLPDAQKAELPLIHHLILAKSLNAVSQLKAEDLLSSDIHGKTALHYAAAMGSCDILDKAKDLGIDINSVRDARGNTLSHIAAAHEKADILRWLSANDVAIDAPNRVKDRPLHSAARNKNEDVVKALLDYGASPSARNNQGITPLYIAINSNQANIASMLLESGVDLKAQLATSGISYQHLAASNASEQTVKALMRAGLEPSDKDFHGNLPLHYAAEAGKLNTVAYLVRLNPGSVYATNDNGETPIQLAIRKSKQEVIDYFLKYYNSEDMGRGTLFKGFSALSKPEPSYKKGTTPLHDAAAQGQLSVVQSIIQKGVDITNQDARGFTALEYAAMGNNWEIMSFLIASGQYDDDKRKQSVFSQAVLYSKSSDLVRSIQASSYGKNLNHLTPLMDNLSPLYLASISLSPSVVQLFIDQGADPNFGGIGKEPPLSAAISGGRFENARLLIEAGARTDYVDDHGSTLLHHAVNGGNLPLVGLLLSSGVPAGHVNKSGTSVLELALKSSQFQTAELILGYNGAPLNLDWTLPNEHHNLLKMFNKIDRISQLNGDARLHRAVRLTNKTLIELMALTDDLNAKNTLGETPLSVCNNEDIYSQLIRLGAIETPQNKERLHNLKSIN